MARPCYIALALIFGCYPFIASQICRKLLLFNQQIFWCWHEAEITTGTLNHFLSRTVYWFQIYEFFKLSNKYLMFTVRCLLLILTTKYFYFWAINIVIPKEDPNLGPQPSTVFEHCWQLKPLGHHVFITDIYQMVYYFSQHLNSHLNTGQKRWPNWTLKDDQISLIPCERSK